IPNRNGTKDYQYAGKHTGGRKILCHNALYPFCLFFDVNAYILLAVNGLAVPKWYEGQFSPIQSQRTGQ
uniref:hypothetical protein n=1 Tax=uncultured Flavonifractor sp. TaxID=1193534 RepID=UPI00260798A3